MNRLILRDNGMICCIPIAAKELHTKRKNMFRRIAIKLMLMMKERLLKMRVLMRRLKKQHQKMVEELPDYMPPENITSLSKSSKSKPRSKEEKRKRKELKKKLPEYPRTQDVLDALEILSSNFYRNVYEKLLFPIYPLGKQPYYRRADVIDLAVSVIHESGAHTFSKLNKEKK